jgi:protein tyrosine/serine phosphatase
MAIFQSVFRIVASILAFATLLSLPSAAQIKADEAEKPESKWAEALDRPGLPNLHKVNDQLYRGAQPEPEGYQELAKMGVKTVICLRDSDPDLKAIQAAKLELVHIPIKTWYPKNEQAVKFLKTVTDVAKQPIYVHCKHGSDRTGTMCAIYRVAVDGWSKNDAIQEMTKGDFGFHPVWTNLIRFIRKLDIDSLKKDAGLQEKGTGA